MQERLNQYLLDGEAVRWCGRPTPFRLLKSVGSTDMLITWALSLFLLVVSVFAILPRISTSGMTESALIVLVICFLPGLLSLRPLRDKRLLEQDTIYAITNYRVIALVRDELMYIPLSSKLQVEVEPQDQGHGIVRFSSALDRDYGSTLANAVAGIPVEGSRYNMKGMLFYHISNPSDVLQYFA